ncbi:hypothetical protein GIB67_030346 [Kingdonia uniflora]|uniref:Phytosulfokine n=1 Tax=Kingdonia uniflora TaxID=39325 RepID=A0A7J7M6P9_9MAGN|nr:hypothetical protein GIB67_030346 [Kingdonia uniflora]
MSQRTTCLILIALLLVFSQTFAARPEPTLPKESLSDTKHAEVDNKAETVESCEGLGEDDCLMRRTLNAHIDYIYTQEAKP